MSMDFNNAESNSGFDLIPNGTIAPMIMVIRPGHQGDGGWESTSDNSDYTWLNCEFQITGGKFKNRKFWQNMMVSGPSEEAINITRSALRGILESARKIDPIDESEAAKAKRIVANYGDFSGLEFVGKVGIEKAKPGSGYDDKNKLTAAVPITSKEYAAAWSGGPVGNVAGASMAAQANQASAGGSMPAWAK